MKRREFFKKTGLLSIFAIFHGLSNKVFAKLRTTANFENRVVWVHDSEATFWDGEGYYGDYVDQSKVNVMIDVGIRELTGQTDTVSAWRQIIPNYTPGVKIGIKININNSGRNNSIDALAEPVNGIIAGLKAMGVEESDIYVLEPSRIFPSRIGDPILELYPDVILWDVFWGKSYGHGVTYESNDPSLVIEHRHPDLSHSILPDQLGELTYLINMPIIKGHPDGAEITLCFKNNFGFCRNIDRFHPYTYVASPDYSYDMNPLHDIYLNTNIRDKTVLIVGDALFGHRTSNAGTPEVWETFGGEFPNSIFMSIDPVAIDSVMFDFSNAESTKPEEAQLYLHRAEELGLGIHEHWDNPQNKKYLNIDFVTIEMSDYPLPVTLISFNALQTDGGVRLSWVTASEINNLGFELWKKTSDIYCLVSSYKNNPSLQGLGNSSTGKEYQYIDSDIEYGKTYYYKLISVDYSGYKRIYKEVKVNITIELKHIEGDAKEFKISDNYPNPFNSITHFDIELKKDISFSIEIYNSLGQKVDQFLYLNFTLGKFTLTWDGSNQPGSVYFYSIFKHDSGNKTIVKSGKMILLK